VTVQKEKKEGLTHYPLPFYLKKKKQQTKPKHHCSRQYCREYISGHGLLYSLSWVRHSWA